MKYDYFIALPMSSFSDAEFKEIKVLIKEIINTLKENNSTVYCAVNFNSDAKFIDEDMALKTDIDALMDSNKFILIYPRKITSSVIFEAGVAYAQNKESIYFVKDINDLPYVMKKADCVTNNIAIHTYSNNKFILDTINKAILKGF